MLHPIWFYTDKYSLCELKSDTGWLHGEDNVTKLHTALKVSNQSVRYIHRISSKYVIFRPISLQFIMAKLLTCLFSILRSNLVRQTINSMKMSLSTMITGQIRFISGHVLTYLYAQVYLLTVRAYLLITSWISCISRNALGLKFYKLFGTYRR